MKHLKPAKILAYITIGLVSLTLPFTAKSSEIKASYNEYNFHSLKHLIPKNILKSMITAINCKKGPLKKPILRIPGFI